MALLSIDTNDVFVSLVYIQQDQRTFLSMTLDTSQGKLILGGAMNNGDILITKTPYDKISTESFLQDQQDLGFAISSLNEYDLIPYQGLITTSKSLPIDTSYTNPFVDINANSTVDQTVVYLKNGNDSYEVYEGNSENFSYDAS